MASAINAAYERVGIILLFGLFFCDLSLADICFPVDYEDTTGPNSCPVGELLVKSQSCTHELVGDQCVLMCQNVCVPDGDYVASWVDEFGVSASYDELGAIPGNGVVSNGAGTYQVPLELVPAKMQPELGLVYNSQGGNGVVGSGWYLSGISSISRCAGTIAQDGRIETVDFDDDDNFCLDGQRLVKLSEGFDVELNANVTEYRLEQEQFVRIRRVHNDDSYFIAEDRTGLRLEYGTDSDSVFEMFDQDFFNKPPSHVYGWGLNRVIDVSGNYRDYKYFDSLSSFDRLMSIEYGGNLNAGTNHYARVIFDYSQGNNLRPDKISGYMAGLGSKVSVDRLLRRIRTEVKINNNYQTVKTYGLDYGLSKITGLSTLTSITECDTNGSCLKPTQFYWEENFYSDQIGPDKKVILLNDDLCNNDYSGCSDDAYQYHWYPDIDGNGMADFCYLGVKKFADEQVTNGDGLQCYLSTTESGFFSVYVNAGLVCGWDQNCDDIDNISTARFADVNADGKEDFVIRYDTGVKIFTLSNNLNDFDLLYYTVICPNDAGCDPYNIHLGDINGDKLLDIVYRHSGDGLKFFINTGELFVEGPVLEGVCSDDDNIEWSGTGICNDADNHKTIRLIDMNKDGRADVVYRGDQGIQIWAAAEVNGQVAFKHWGASEICKNGAEHCNDADNHYYIYYPDINGDGLNDLCYRSDIGIRCQMNIGFQPLVGNVFQGTVIQTGICANTDQNCNDTENYQTIQFVDWNVDGKSDLVVRKDSGIRIYLSKGDHFELVDSLFDDICADGSVGFGVCNDWDNHATIRFGNIDGKGSLELMYRGDEGIQARSTWFNDKPIGLMTKVVDGLGIEAEFQYKPLTDSSVYTKLEEEVEYPLYHNYGPQYVVSQLSNSDGLGGENVTTYHYRHQVVHLLGWGSLGFKEVESQNLTANTKELVEYSQYYPKFHGRIKEQRGYAWYNNAWVLVNNTDYGWQATTLNDGEIARHRVSVSSEINHSYELNGNWYKTSHTNYQRDEYDNPTKIETDTYGEDGLYYTMLKDMKYDYDIGDSWALSLGVVYRQSMTKTAPEETLLSEVLVTEMDMPSITNVAEYQYYPNGLVRNEIREPDYDEYKLTSSYTYDVFGNTIKQIQSGLNEASRVVETSYDPTGLYEEFNWTVVNGIEHKKESKYDPRFGLLKQEISVNGHIKTYSYDDYGRLLQTNYADGAWEKVHRYHCDANCSGLPLAMYYTVESSSTGSQSRSFYDQLNRKLRSQTQSLNGAWSTVDVEYNHKGQDYRQSEPYFMGDDIYWSEKEYDALGRVTQVTYPDFSTSTMTYNGLTQIEINAKEQSKTITANVLGQTKAVTDTLGNVMKYYYDAQGNERGIQDYKEMEEAYFIVIKYDLLGRKISMNDPDMGIWNYGYNVFNELIFQRDARGNEIWNQYDPLGRLWKREEFTLEDGLITTDWMYDIQPYGIGQLAEVVSDAYGYEYYEYDELSRVIQVTKTVGTKEYTVGTTYYPGSSQIKETIYPTELTVAHIYNEYGYVFQVIDVSTGTIGLPGTIYWEALSMDARGNVNQFRLGNDVETTRYYDQATGMLKDNVSVSAGNLWTVQDEHYNFDVLGNLEERIWFTGEEVYRETFQYDELNRLEWSRVYDGFNIEKQAVGVNYDNRGNITYKSDVGTYVYGDSCTNDQNEIVHSGPHAVTAIINGPQTNSYCYDENGSRVSSLTKDQAISYNSFNKVKRIEQGMGGEEPTYTTFHYGVDRNLARRVDHPWNVNGEQAIYTNYIGGIYEEVQEYMFNNLQNEKHRHYIGDYAVVVLETNEEAKAQYFHRDHLGSLVATSNGFNAQTDLVQERFNFDAWGQRRQLDLDEEPLDLFEFKSLITESNESFGGHEQLDTYGLVNMGGRIYDPIIGRFIQADPMIQEASNLQNLNRYTYVLNNPLSYTDPSGYFWQTLLNVGVVALGFVNPALAIVAGLLVGAATTAITGDGAAFVGAVLGTATAGIGNLIGSSLKGISNAIVTVLKGAVSGAIGGALTSGLAHGWEHAGAGAWRGAVSGSISSAATYGVSQSLKAIQMAKVRKADHSVSEAFHGGYDGDKKTKEVKKIAKNLKPRAVGNKRMDQTAVAALTDPIDAPVGEPFERLFVIRMDESGNYCYEYIGIPGVVGGNSMNVPPGNQVKAIAHTHPLLTQETIAQHKYLSNDVTALNRENAHTNNGDVRAVKKTGSPNYYRTPDGSAVKVIERVHIVKNSGKLVHRIKTRTVWENGKFIN